MFFKSVRFKLAIWYTTLLIICFVIFGVVSYLSMSSILLSNLDSSLKSEINWLKDNVDPKYNKKKLRKKNTLVFTPQVQPAKPKPSKLKKSQPIVKKDTTEIKDIDPAWNKIYEHLLLSSKNNFIIITDSEEEEIYKSDNLKHDSLVFIGKIENDKILYGWSSNLFSKSMRQAILKNSEIQILVGYPFEEVSGILNDLFSILVFMIPISFGISIIGGVFLARKSLAAVAQITQTARDISITNLNQRIPYNQVDDEIGRLVLTFNDMIERLQISFEQTKQFSNNVSHELRTPLTIIRGEIEIALKSDKTGTKYKEVLKSCLDEIVRMSKIIDSLLTLTKAEAGQADIHLEEIKLDNLVMEIYEDCEILAEQKGIKLFLNKLDESNIKGDKIKLRQLFLNLIDNAIKYNKEKGSVEISLIRGNNYAKVIIKDTGIGIPNDLLDKIFDRFYRVDKDRTGEVSGSGLGLSISKWIVELHKGEMLVESKINEGSTFTVRFPAIEIN